jgi:hypothetical protein
MSTTTSITLLPTTSYGTETGNYDGSSASFQSNKVKGDGYYGFSDGLHTAQLRVTGFVGTLQIQASLATDPSSTDWADISSAVLTGDGSTAITDGYFYNFTGNYVWIRANITAFTAGTINSLVVMN